MSETAGKPWPEPPAEPEFSEMRGAFVTLSGYPSGYLRGCIGYPYPAMPLARTLREAASAACHDPRFADLTAEEAESVTVEVTVLTFPEPMEGSPEEIMASVTLGRDGLMLELGGRRGLFLPQVPSEQGWDVRQYLENLSFKAGLPAEMWKDPGAKIYRFQGEIFSETAPSGPAERREP